MRKRLRIAAFVVVGVLLALAVGIFALYRASQHVPEFYQDALAADPSVQEDASDQMVQQATALASDVAREGRWQAVFTAEQINGWLAVDMMQNHRDLLPAALRDPRVAIEPEQVTLACRMDRGNWSSVFTLAVDVYLAEPDVVALRIRDARAGALPLPLEAILEEISQKASRMGQPIRWRQAQGDPVLEISIPPPRDAGQKVIRIETLPLGEAKVYLSGSTRRQ